MSRAKKCPIEEGDSDYYLRVPVCGVWSGRTRSSNTDVQTEAGAMSPPPDCDTSKSAPIQSPSVPEAASPQGAEASSLVEIPSKAKKPNEAMSSFLSSEEMLNKLYNFHVRGGHPSADRIFDLYRRLYGKSHPSAVTRTMLQDRLKLCRCFTAKHPTSANFVPIYPSTNRELFLDFKEIGTMRCPLVDGKKSYRLTVFEPLSGAVWSLPVL